MKAGGDFLVKRTLDAQRRVNQGLIEPADLADARILIKHSHHWQRLQSDDNGVQSVVFPDADTCLTEGWEVVIHNYGGTDALEVFRNGEGTAGSHTGSVDMSGGFDWGTTPQDFNISIDGATPFNVTLNTLTTDVATTVAEINAELVTNLVYGVVAEASGNNIVLRRTALGSGHDYALTVGTVDALVTLGWTAATYTGTGSVFKEIQIGSAYKFTLVENSDDAGVWYVNWLEDHEFTIAPRFVDLFNATTDWGTIVDNDCDEFYYDQEWLAATHGRGDNPAWQIFEKSGTDYKKVFGLEEWTDATSDIHISVSGEDSEDNDDDARFEGKIVAI